MSHTNSKISEKTKRKILEVMEYKTCRAKEYKDNSVIFHGSIICWGFMGQPKCKYLEECLLDYRDDFINDGRKRKFNNLLKKVRHENTS
jgi:hypothetical protein